MERPGLILRRVLDTAGGLPVLHADAEEHGAVVVDPDEAEAEAEAVAEADAEAQAQHAAVAEAQAVADALAQAEQQQHAGVEEDEEEDAAGEDAAAEDAVAEAEEQAQHAAVAEAQAVADALAQAEQQQHAGVEEDEEDAAAEDAAQTQLEQSVVDVNTDEVASALAHEEMAAGAPDITIMVARPPWVSFLLAGLNSHPDPEKPYEYVVATGRFCGTNFAQQPEAEHSHLVVVRHLLRDADGALIDAPCAVPVPDRSDLAQPQVLDLHRLPPGRVLRVEAGALPLPVPDHHCRRCVAVLRYVENIEQTGLPLNPPMLVGVSPVNSSVVYFSLDQRLFGVNVPEHTVVDCAGYEPLKRHDEPATSRYFITWNLDADGDASWKAQKRSIVYFRGQPIGTVAALNYDQVFMRNFIPSALAFLMKETARLQSSEKFDLFEVHHCYSTQKTESLLADLGETAIGRVAPADSGLWWITLLRSYNKWTGGNSLAESPNCQRAMHLILRLCLSEGCDTSPALLCADGCSMIDRRMVFMRNFIPSALAFLMKETARLQSSEKFDLFEVHHCYSTQKTESLLADLGETAIGRVAPADSCLWWITLVHAYTKWTGDNSLAESLNCQRAMHLILRLCLSEECDTSPSLLCADGCSMIDPRMGICRYPLEFQALSFMAKANASSEFIKRSIVYFKGRPIRTVAAVDKPQVAAFNYDNEGSSSLNTAMVCLDGSDEEVLASFRTAIGRIRWYCKMKGKRVELSRIFGPNIEVFTTPEDGTIFLTLKYKNRSLTLCLKARDLYIMGWRSEHGSYEIRLENEKSYMVGKDITVVNCSKNYSKLSPNGDVSLTRIGPKAVRDAFEVLFKCRGEPSREVKQAIGRYAVLFSESVRLQSVFNTICLSYSDPDFCECQLDNTRYENNSFWITRYGHYSGQLMSHINELKAERIPKQIKNKGDDDISSCIDILREIRVLLLDGCYEDQFHHKRAPEHMTETPLTKKHHPKSHMEDEKFPTSLLENLPEPAELEQRYKEELERISEVRSRQAQQTTLNSITGKSGEFLNQFPAVKRRFTTLGTSSASSTAGRVLLPQRLAAPLPLQKPHMPTVQRVYAPPRIEKLQAPSVLRLQPPAQPRRIHCLQPNLARATRFIGRIIRFVH